MFLAERLRTEMEKEQEDHVSAAWRRFRDALASAFHGDVTVPRN
jgi:hypothetical protein